MDLIPHGGGIGLNKRSLHFLLLDWRVDLNFISIEIGSFSSRAFEKLLVRKQHAAPKSD